jgi:hypothetical protein
MNRALALALAGLLGALLGASGCASLCADQGTREGAWGLVFRCSTPERS